MSTAFHARVELQDGPIDLAEVSAYSVDRQYLHILVPHENGEVDHQVGPPMSHTLQLVLQGHGVARREA